jgi:chemotaxis protein histidine kinase CheA
MTVEPAPESEPPFLDMFLDSAEQLVGRLSQDIEDLHRAASSPEALQALKGLRHGFHALRGNSSFVAGCPITPMAHRAEEAVEAASEGRVDARQLLDPLADVIDRCKVRLAEYRQLRTSGAPDPQESSLVASLQALARGGNAGARARANGPRYFYSGHDVTEILELLLTRHEAIDDAAGAGGESSEERIAQAQELLRRLATDAGDEELAKLAADGEGATGDLLRLLVRKVERVAGEGGGREGRGSGNKRAGSKRAAVKRTPTRNKARKKPRPS